jgi:exopolyphosphatase/guanosine-5'-triphosphate,3'-diphosphate pyrophosphatase
VNAISRRAIIDIGSNTVRLVVFGGVARAPLVLYNEKVTVGLGRGVIADGRMTDEAMDHALAALGRFEILLEAFQPEWTRVVATAAVRDAANGEEFLERVRALGLDAELLSGDDEAVAAGFGVVAAMPRADGVVADLGGGSLELVRVGAGQVSERVSLPLGLYAAGRLRIEKPGRLRRRVQQMIAEIPWMWSCNDLPLYLVGGSWRSLARVHLHRTGFPLPVLGNYAFAADAARPFAQELQTIDAQELAAIPAMPSGRVAGIVDAAALLAALVEAIAPSSLVISPFGLREGLLYQALDENERCKDPLIEGVRFVTGRHDQFPGLGDALATWLQELFSDESDQLARLRHSVCHMVGTGWASNPEFRALSGEELALHGNWIGVDVSERAIMGRALFTGLGGSGDAPAILAQLAQPELLDRANAWGLAVRLGQRLSGGATAILEQSRLSIEEDRLTLTLPPGQSGLVDDTLRRRLGRLANAIGHLHRRKLQSRIFDSAG